MAPALQPAAAPKRGRRWTRWLKRIAVTLVVLLVAFVFGWAPWYLGGLVTIRRFAYNDKENDGLTPASFELPFEDVDVQRRRRRAARRAGGCRRRTRRAPSSSSHGLNRSRIEMVKKVPFLHEQGWNALLFDLRHHGASGGDRPQLRLPREGRRARGDRVRAQPGAGPGRALGRLAWARPSVTLAAAEDPTVAGARVRQQLPQPARHRPPSPGPLPRVPVVAAHRAAPGRSPTRSCSGWAARAASIPTRVDVERRRGAPGRAARALRLQLGRPAHAPGDRVRPQGGGRRPQRTCSWSPATATAAPSATAPPPTRPP